MADDVVILGAVAYAPKVVTIWEGICDHFREQGLPLDMVLFMNYERQVHFLLDGRIDIAWNTPLAHVRVKQRTDGCSMSLGMRDSDRDFRSRIIVRRDAGIGDLKDLEGRRLAVGSRDSTQARILPLYFLRQEGVDLQQIQIIPFDTDVGKHGDTGNSELEVLQAVHEGQADAGVVGELIWEAQQATAQGASGVVESLWTTPPFDHCMFDARVGLDKEVMEKFTTALWAMQWENPVHRRLLELEGLKQWMPPREEGYQSLVAAMAEQGIA